MANNPVTEAREAYFNYVKGKEPCPICRKTSCEHSIHDQRNELFNQYLRAIEDNPSIGRFSGSRK